MPFDPPIPFADWMGFQLVHSADGHCELAFEPGAQHLNAFQIVHGGVSMSLLDVALSSAARSVQSGSRVLTLEMKTSFLRPAKGALKAFAHVLHHTEQLAFAEAQVLDRAGRLCAQASGTFKYLRPTSARQLLDTSSTGLST